MGGDTPEAGKDNSQECPLWECPPCRPHLRRRVPGVPERRGLDPGPLGPRGVRVFLLPLGGSPPAIPFGYEKRLPGGDAPDPAGRKGARGGTGRARNPFAALAVAAGRRPVPPSGRANPLPRPLPVVRREEAPGLPPAPPSPVTAKIPPVPPFRTGTPTRTISSRESPACPRRAG